MEIICSQIAGWITTQLQESLSILLSVRSCEVKSRYQFWHPGRTALQSICSSKDTIMSGLVQLYQEWLLFWAFLIALWTRTLFTILGPRAGLLKDVLRNLKLGLSHLCKSDGSQSGASPFCPLCCGPLGSPQCEWHLMAVCCVDATPPQSFLNTYSD